MLIQSRIIINQNNNWKSKNLLNRIKLNWVENHFLSVDPKLGYWTYT